MGRAFQRCATKSQAILRPKRGLKNFISPSDLLGRHPFEGIDSGVARNFDASPPNVKKNSVFFLSFFVRFVAFVVADKGKGRGIKDFRHLLDSMTNVFLFFSGLRSFGYMRVDLSAHVVQYENPTGGFGQLPTPLFISSSLFALVTMSKGSSAGFE